MSISSKPIFRRFWSEIPEELMKMSHDLAECFMGCRWYRYGGEPEATCDGVIMACNYHPMNFSFMGVGNPYPESTYILDDGRYPRNIRRCVHIPGHMDASNFKDFNVQSSSHVRMRDFSPATEPLDMMLLEAIVRDKHPVCIDPYCKNLKAVLKKAKKFKKESVTRFDMIHADPESRLRAMHMTWKKFKNKWIEHEPDLASKGKKENDHE